MDVGMWVGGARGMEVEGMCLFGLGWDDDRKLLLLAVVCGEEEGRAG